MVAVQKTRGQKLVTKSEKQREKNWTRRAAELGITVEEYAARVEKRKQAREGKEQRIDQGAEQVAQAWNQSLRAKKYLPTLYQQREKLVSDLAELDALIEDERKFVAKIEQRYT